MKKLICLVCTVSLLFLSGCSGGSIYTNYREIEQLMVIQTIGFDKDERGISLSVSMENSSGGNSSQQSSDGSSVSGTGSGSAGGSSKGSHLSVTAETISVAQEKLLDYSPSEELFFAHTSYITIGEETAKESLLPYLMYIARNTAIREDTPVFILIGSTASDIVLGAGGKDYDVSNVLSSIERNIKHRGDCEILSASDITANLNQRNASLVTTIKCAKAKNVMGDAKESEMTAVPAGYAVIANNKMIGSLDLCASRGVSILQNKLKSCYAEIEVSSNPIALLLEKCSCRITPTVSDGVVKHLDIKVDLSSSLAESVGQPQLEKINRALEAKTTEWIKAALDKEIEYGCDFLGLGSILELQHPFNLSGFSECFSTSRDILSYNINVSAEVTHSFDIENTEGTE